MRPRAAEFVAVLVVFGAGAIGCAPRRDDSAPRPTRSIVLVTLDTFRADHLGSGGHPTSRTPVIDRLARRGMQWSEALSAIPLTTPSHATILTGWSPRAHGLLKNRMALDTTRVTVAETLAARGFRTDAIVSNATVLAAELRLDQGFASYRVVEPPALPASGEGRETARLAAEALAAHPGPGLFLWAHFFDAHLPYLPPPPLDVLHQSDGSRDTASLYAGEVTFLDGCVGRITREIERTDAAAHTVVVVTADHGEGLGEHDGYFGHDVQLYDTSLRVPLVVSGADVPPGRVLSEPARTTDLAATMFGIAGVPADERPPNEGRDLLADPPPTGDAAMFIAETHPARAKATPMYALRTETAKVIWEPRHGRREMYELGRDPGERFDLAANPPDLLRVLGEDLELDLRHRPVGHTRTVDDLRGGADEATVQALESLGYVGD